MAPQNNIKVKIFLCTTYFLLFLTIKQEVTVTHAHISSTITLTKNYLQHFEITFFSINISTFFFYFPCTFKESANKMLRKE